MRFYDSYVVGFFRATVDDVSESVVSSTHYLRVPVSSMAGTVRSVRTVSCSTRASTVWAGRAPERVLGPFSGPTPECVGYKIPGRVVEWSRSGNSLSDLRFED